MCAWAVLAALPPIGRGVCPPNSQTHAPTAPLTHSLHASPACLPLPACVRAGDPYKEEMEHCIDLVMAELRRRGVPNSHTLAYQSRVGPVEWLKPYTDDSIRWGRMAACCDLGACVVVMQSGAGELGLAASSCLLHTSCRLAADVLCTACLQGAGQERCAQPAGGAHQLCV